MGSFNRCEKHFNPKRCLKNENDTVPKRCLKNENDTEPCSNIRLHIGHLHLILSFDFHSTKNKNHKLQHLTIQRCIQIGCQCSLYLCSRLHVKAVPTLLSLLRRGTKASCPSSLRRPSEKAGKEKVTGPTAAEVVAESCWTAP